MSNLPHEVIGAFIDAVVRDPARADQMLAERAELLNARWIHDETVLHFVAIEGFTEGLRFPASRGADVDAVNEFGDSALVPMSRSITDALKLQDVPQPVHQHLLSTITWFDR